MVMVGISKHATDEYQQQTGETVGFRDTEIGPIPADWKLVSVGSLFSFKNGLNKAKQFFGYGTPIINYMDVFSKSGLRSGDIAGLVDVSRKEIDSFSCKKGDVFFTRTSETLDEIGVASVLLEDIENAVFSGFVLRARPINDDLVDDFKKYCFASTSVRQQIVSKGTYTTRALTNGRVLSSILLAVPPAKSEQQAISDSLNDADTQVEALEQLIKKKRLIKQGMMQELLTGKIRLPGFSGEWETKRVSVFGDIVTGATPSTDIDAFWGGQYPWITPTDISFQRDMTSSERMITQEGLNSIRTLPANSVLVTCIASIGKNAILKTKGSCNQQINAVIPNAAHSAEFLYYLFELNTRYLLAKAGITATSIVSKKTFGGLRFKIPFVNEQRAIASALSDIDTEIAALEKRRDKARAIKQGMMQELLTGRVRLI